MDTIYVVDGRRRTRYGCFAFLLDFFLTIMTGGLWIIWIVVRQWRRGR
jgi:hypothetical protein